MARWWWRLRAGMSLAVIVLIAAAAPALADDDKPAPSGAILDMFGITTTDGTKLSQEELAVSTRYKAFGKELPDPLLQIIGIIWYLYRVIVGFSLWFLRTAQNGAWRTDLVNAVDSTVTPYLTQLHDLGLPAVVGSAGTAIAVWAWVRGRTGASFGELGMVMVILALATGIFASPVVTITEPGGYLDKTFSTARGLSAGMGEGSGDSTSRTEQRMADILVAQPAELMTFGELLSAECSKKHTAALKKHAGKDEADKIRDEVGKCDERYKESMPLEAVFGVGLFTWPFLTTMLAALSMLSALIIYLVCSIVWFSIAIAWNVIWGIAPGEARMRLVNSLIKTVTALAALVVALVAASLASQLLVALFDSVRGDDGSGLIDTFRAYAIASTVMTLMWMVLWWKTLSHLLRSRRRAEKTKAIVNPSQPVSMPAAAPWGGALAGLGQAGMNAAGSALGAKLGNRNRASGPAPVGMPNYGEPESTVTNTPTTTAPAGPATTQGQVTGRSPRLMLPPAPDQGPGPDTAPPAQGPQGGGGPQPYANSLKSDPNRLKKRLVKTSTRLAAHAALAVATGGTSTMASAAGSTVAKAAASAGQSALKKQLQTARQQGTTGVAPRSMNDAPQRRQDQPPAPTTPAPARPSTPTPQATSNTSAPVARPATSRPAAQPKQPNQPQRQPATWAHGPLKDMTPSADPAPVARVDRDAVTPKVVAENRAQELRERLAKNDDTHRAPVAIK